MSSCRLFITELSNLRSLAEIAAAEDRLGLDFGGRSEPIEVHIPTAGLKWNWQWFSEGRRPEVAGHQGLQLTSQAGQIQCCALDLSGGHQALHRCLLDVPDREHDLLHA